MRNQIYLGTDTFVEKMQRTVEAAQDLSEAPTAQRRLAKPLDYYTKSIRIETKRFGKPMPRADIG